MQQMRQTTTPRSASDYDLNSSARKQGGRVETEESDGGVSCGQLAPLLENLTEEGEELMVPLKGRMFRIQLIGVLPAAGAMG